MSFGEHLEELRKRLIWAIVSVLPIFIAALAFGDRLLAILIHPAQRELHRAGLPAMLIVTNPLETLSAWLKVSAVVTLVIGIPLILYQLWLFVAPGLYDHEKRFAQILMPMSVVLSAIGLAFLYFVMLPAMLIFLIHFGMDLGKPVVHTAPRPAGIVLPVVPSLEADPDDPQPGEMWFNRELNQFRMNVASPGDPPQVRGTPLVMNAGISQQYKVSEYIGLLFTTSLAFALGFQTPVVVLLLGWVGIVDRKFLTKNRRYAVFISAIAAAILAPSPDPFSLLVLAIPLYGLYELGLFLLQILPAERVIRGFKKKKPAPDAEVPPEEPPPVELPEPGEPIEHAQATGMREPPDAGDE